MAWEYTAVNSSIDPIKWEFLTVSCSCAAEDPDIRYCVLASLDERFDAHLAQAENLQALFVALNDEVFEIRELAICTIGRLSSMNPAFVMPFLRKMLIQVDEAQQIEHYERFNYFFSSFSLLCWCCIHFFFLPIKVEFIVRR